MSCERKVANALGGKTARACDSCLRKRARWFCAADDAFLCQACDTLVHSANQLASRHERVRLETSSHKVATVVGENSLPSWHQGVTRKARTPRNGKPTTTQPDKEEKIANPILMVPEMGSEDGSLEENDNSEEQLLYQVPVFDPFDAELCNVNADNDDEFNALLNDEEVCDLNIPEFFTSDDMELAEFAADVESLLGTAAAAGIVDEHEANNVLDVCFEIESNGKVKVELDDEDELEVRDVIACHFDPALDMVRETLNDWDFDYGSSSMNVEDEDHDQKMMNIDHQTPIMAMDDIGNDQVDVKRKMVLRLDYDAVIAAWDGQSSPWKDGIRPEFDPHGGWPDISGICMGENHKEMIYGGHEHGRLSDGGREARVSRYREKRRTRLFSKKIRYEVRKLNAEKRPRMKGRFVKRTSIIGQTSSYLVDK